MVIVINTPVPGSPDGLHEDLRPDPVAGPLDVLIEVAAAGVNRADVLQRQGHYPPPAGASDVLGLEVSGQITDIGRDVSGWAVGDEVCALLTGGGYAERVVVPATQVLPVPAGVDMVTAAALPEAVCTVWSNLAMAAGLRSGQTLLVHGGSGGIGTMAIQIGRALGARVLCTAGSAADLCLDLGAEQVIDYRTDDFVEACRSATDGRGVDVVLDVMGAAYLDRNLRALAPDGRLVVIGLQGGSRAEVDLGRLLSRRLSVLGTTLRALPAERKAEIIAGVRANVWRWIESGEVRPVVAETYALADAGAAHRRLEAGGVRGKLLLVVERSGRVIGR